MSGKMNLMCQAPKVNDIIHFYEIKIMEPKYDVFIIEGIDRLGKDTLIKNIQHALGFHFVIHYSKPEKLEVYNNSLEQYQRCSFENGFRMMYGIARSFNSFATPLIFNRFHLGENVYAPLYRGYSGDYVFDMEKIYDDLTPSIFQRVKMILLTTSDFSFIQDDGESFDFSKKEDEQEMFKSAFAKSILPNKCVIDVANGSGGFRSPAEIVAEALK